MRPRRLVLVSLVSALLAGILPPSFAVQAQQLPRSVTIGTNPPGSIVYTWGAGFAKLISETTPIQAVVQPHTGATTHLQLTNQGELDFALDNAVHLGLAYQQSKIGGRGLGLHAPNVRLVMRGAALIVGLLARKDSTFKTAHDIKGARVAGEYPAQLIGWYLAFGALASAGLMWSDVKVVPVPAVLEGIDALVQGRVDVAIASVNSPKVKEADAARGVRYIPVDCSPGGEERLKAAVPGFYPRMVRPGAGDPAVVAEMCLIAFDMYLLTNKTVAEQTVATVLKAIFNNLEKLHPMHPNFREWTRERAVSPDMTIPYHPGAIQLYRERGFWSVKMDDAQKKLLAVNP